MTRTSSREILDLQAYATAADFEQIFTNEMSGFYLLSFLLTGDRDKAEECFVSAIGESTKGKRVFKEWARSWARRSIVQSAIRVMVSRQHSETNRQNSAVARDIDKLPLVLQAEVFAIIALSPLERFVFVMSVLERYTDHDCSILLGCSRRDVTAARARALQQLGRLMGFQRNEADAPEYSAAHENSRPAIEWTIARYFATQAWNSSLSHDAPLWP